MLSRADSNDTLGTVCMNYGYVHATAARVAMSAKHGIRVYDRRANVRIA
ncbi:MAG: hypothetical protein IBJ12_04910 [Sphingomonadaceae bacterium]|nr:hypothetical protein [Sphingomonadaceae bacterium]